MREKKLNLILQKTNSAFLIRVKIFLIFSLEFLSGHIGTSNATSSTTTQKHHDTTRRRHRIPGNRYHLTRRSRLGYDAVVLRLQLHARSREARETRELPAVLRRRAAHRHSSPGRTLRLQARAQRPTTPFDLGGHASIDSRRRPAGHHQL